MNKELREFIYTMELDDTIETGTIKAMDRDEALDVIEEWAIAMHNAGQDTGYTRLYPDV